MSRQMCGYLPKAYLEYFLGRMLPRRQRRRCNRIYISRRRSPIGRRVLNEDEVVRMLNSFGFESVALETLPLDAQIELFFDAEAVVGVHGAGLTNLLFSDAAAVTELHPRRAVLPHYYFLCKAMGHDYRSLCSNASTRDSDIYVDVDALAATLREQLDGSPPQSASA
jgi:capsular polysaccharide biosynthesis protein